MRPPLHSDLIAVARLLRERPAHMQGWVLRRVLAEASQAHLWMQRTREPHPIWGDGAVMTAAFRRGIPGEYGLHDQHYCACLSTVALAFASQRRNSGTSEP